MPVLPKADIVLTNGRVFLGLNEGVADAIALWAGHVLGAGTAADMEPLIGPSTRVIDLAGRLATPGLCDSHMHLLPYGIIMGHVDVRPASAPTLTALLERVRQRALATPPGQWIQGRGYDQFELDVRRHPLREELDAVAPDHPVAIVRACGHVTICNSKALELAGIDEMTPVPQGGAIEQRDGRLTGLLAETGRDRLKGGLPRGCGLPHCPAPRPAAGADDPMPPRRSRRHCGTGLCGWRSNRRGRFHAPRRSRENLHGRQRWWPDGRYERAVCRRTEDHRPDAP